MDPTTWSTRTQVIAASAVTAAAVGGVVLYRSTIPVPGHPVPEQQAIFLPPEREGESHILRSNFAADRLVKKCFDDVSTLWENFNRGLGFGRSRRCLGYRKLEGGPYIWRSYGEVYDEAKAVGSGLQNSLGFEPGDFVGIYSKNRNEWTVTEQGCNGYSMTVVPLYDTLGTNAIKYICNQAELRVVFCSADKLDLLLDSIRSGIEGLKYIVCYDDVDKAKQELVLEELGVNILTYKNLVQLGKTSPKDPVPPKPEDLATICYTSGTTGDPKGVMLTHENLIAAAAGIIVTGRSLYTKDDVHISYLPLAHMFERIVQIVFLGSGSSIGFFRGNVKEHLFDDIKTLKPTIFPSVPRLFNRLYDVAWGKLQALTGFRKTLFEKAWAAKKEALKHGSVKHPLWDALVFSKVADFLGGRVRLMVTGSAPIGPDVMDFLRIAFSCTVLEGYGQTESAAGVAGTLLGSTATGTVGPPIPCNDVKLVDVPEMDYYTSHKEDGVSYPQGEICFRGHNVCKGYYKMPEKTAETIDEDGWLRSGDIGQISPEGTLKIIDRKKNIFKLAHGEYIAPEKIENVIVKSPLVAQVFIHGDSLKACLVAIIVPDEEYVASVWAEENDMKGKGFEEICKSPELKEAILTSLKAICKDDGLLTYEIPRDIALISELFSVENELLTPTFKLKRNEARKVFVDEIDEMYSHLD